MQQATTVASQAYPWTERRLYVRSLARAKREAQALHHKLTTVQAAVAKLCAYKRGKRVYRSEAELQTAVTGLVAAAGVSGLLALSYSSVADKAGLC